MGNIHLPEEKPAKMNPFKSDRSNPAKTRIAATGAIDESSGGRTLREFFAVVIEGRLEGF